MNKCEYCDTKGIGSCGKYFNSFGGSFFMSQEPDGMHINCITESCSDTGEPIEILESDAKIKYCPMCARKLSK